MFQVTHLINILIENLRSFVWACYFQNDHNLFIITISLYLNPIISQVHNLEWKFYLFTLASILVDYLYALFVHFFTDGNAQCIALKQILNESDGTHSKFKNSYFGELQVKNCYIQILSIKTRRLIETLYMHPPWVQQCYARSINIDIQMFSWTNRHKAFIALPNFHIISTELHRHCSNILQSDSCIEFVNKNHNWSHTMRQR